MSKTTHHDKKESQSNKTNDSLEYPKRPRRTAVQDEPDLSYSTAKIATLKDKLAEISELRADKIEKLKKAIEKGEYKVDSNAIALKMIKESIQDDLS